MEMRVDACVSSKLLCLLITTKVQGQHAAGDNKAVIRKLIFSGVCSGVCGSVQQSP